MKENILKTFHTDKPIIGMLHLNGFTPDRVHEWAKREIEQMYGNGIDAVLAEDYFGTPDDVEWVLDYLHSQYPDCVYGVNLLGDTERGFRLAKQYGAAFLQMDSVCGHLRPGCHMKGHDKPNLDSKTCDGDFAERLEMLRTECPVFLLGGVRQVSAGALRPQRGTGSDAWKAALRRGCYNRHGDRDQHRAGKDPVFS